MKVILRLSAIDFDAGFYEIEVSRSWNTNSSW